jgi:hypothetical protein
VTLTEQRAPTDADLAEARAFLGTLKVQTLSAMLDTLLPGIRCGEAGPATWAAVTAIREELEHRLQREADGNH